LRPGPTLFDRYARYVRAQSWEIEMGDKTVIAEPGDKIITDGDKVVVEEPAKIEKKKVTTETTTVTETKED